MTRRYAYLAAGALLLGAIPILLGRLPRAESVGPPVAAPPIERIEIAVSEGAVTPASVRVPVNTRVRLRVTNRGATLVRLSLAGYEDRMAAPALEPGRSLDREFTADLPGEDFFWLVNDEPRGRLVVSGDHLVEGHR